MLCLGLGYLFRCEARAEVTEFYLLRVLRDHDVVWFEICMDNLVPVQQAEGQKELSSVQDYSIKTKPDVATKLVEGLSEIQPHALVD